MMERVKDQTFLRCYLTYLYASEKNMEVPAEMRGPIVAGSPEHRLLHLSSIHPEDGSSEKNHDDHL